MLEKAFNAEHVLSVAESLAAQEGEAHQRSAISRAYYGAFLLARDIAHIEDETARAHARTWRHYIDMGEKHLARDLSQLRDARNTADYDTDINMSKEECRHAMQASRRVHAALQRVVGREQYRAELTTEAKERQ